MSPSVRRSPADAPRRRDGRGPVDHGSRDRRRRAGPGGWLVVPGCAVASRRDREQRSLEERIAERLDFWLLGQRRTGREPSAEDADATRAELLAEVVAAGGGVA